MQGGYGMAAAALGEDGERERIKCQVQSMVCSSKMCLVLRAVMVVLDVFWYCWRCGLWHCAGTLQCSGVCYVCSSRVKKKFFFGGRNIKGVPVYVLIKDLHKLFSEVGTY